MVWHHLVGGSVILSAGGGEMPSAGLLLRRGDRLQTQGGQVFPMVWIMKGSAATWQQMGTINPGMKRGSLHRLHEPDSNDAILFYGQTSMISPCLGCLH